MKSYFQLPYKVPQLYLGFYSGAVFGLVLSYVPACFVSVLYISDPQLFGLVLSYFSSFLGWTCVFIMVVSFVSHFIRQRYGLVTGCRASSYCASEEEEL